MSSGRKECGAFIVTETDQIAPQMQAWQENLLLYDGSDSGVHQPWLSLWIYRGVIGALGQLKESDANEPQRPEILALPWSRVVWRDQ